LRASCPKNKLEFFQALYIIHLFLILYEPFGKLYLVILVIDYNSLLDTVDGTKETKGASKVQNSIRIMKEKISLLSKRGKKLVKKEKKLKSQLDKFKGLQ